MVNLTFGEQVKLILGRKGMTIKELAELIERHTGKSMSRQNLTQRLGRDNFQEQDMRMIAELLGCKFQLSIMEMTGEERKLPEEPLEKDVTIGDLVRLNEELQIEKPIPEVVKEPLEESVEQPVEKEKAEDLPVPEKPEQKENDKESNQEKEMLKKGIRGYYRKQTPAEKAKEKQAVPGDVNPYTGKEYESNSVRMHPKRIGYVQVYDREQHKWIDMTEWAFLGYEERKKVLQGKNYRPPIYLD